MDSINPRTFWYGWTIRWLWYDTPVQLPESGCLIRGGAKEVLGG
jgi:hypothetical protein